MLERELQWERDLFFFLNGSESGVLDNFFFLYSWRWTWVFFYFCFVLVFIHRKNWKEICCTLGAIVLVILLCDQISSGFFKPVFHRFRPTHHPDFQEQVKIVLNYRGGRYGFISGHAANACGFATFTALLFRNKVFTLTISLFALFNAYSRIYLGVHFISDVVAGALLGIAMGWAVYRIYNYVRHKYLKINKENLKIPIYTRCESYFLSGVYILIVIFLLVFNNQLITILI